MLIYLTLCYLLLKKLTHLLSAICLYSIKPLASAGSHYMQSEAAPKRAVLERVVVCTSDAGPVLTSFS